MSKETGGPAYPLPLGTVTVEGQEGMTLRDYFAAKAMQSVIHRYEGKGFGGNAESPEFIDVAEQAYFMADAMLESRK